jgi:hypothetical protein
VVVEELEPADDAEAAEEDLVRPRYQAMSFGSRVP